MYERMICKCGHEWNVEIRTDAETTDATLRCPKCRAQANRLKAPIIDAYAATLPPRDGTSQSTFTGKPAEEKNGKPPPAQIQGFDIIRELGRGGMGVVYLARHQKLGRLVALKMVLSGSHAGETERSRFQAEAAAVARLQHPNIVQIHEVGESEGRPYFCLEFVDGGSLADQLKGNPIPAREAAAFLAPLARAVQAAHAQDLVHRDLKPANILLRREVGAHCADGVDPDRVPLTAFQPKITDFGLAKNLEAQGSQTQSGTVLGTPSYMAPEQAGGHSRLIGPSTDVYALGAILYEMMTGRPPFRGETPLDTVLQVMSDEPVKPSVLQPKCSRDLETICLKCLEKDARKRYAGAQDLADDLQRFLDNEPIVARPVGVVGRTVRWSRRHPGVAALLGLIGVLLTTSFLIVLALWRRAEADRAVAIEDRKKAAKQEERARSNLGLAIEAVDRMLTRVSDEKLAYVPQFEDERRKILEEAVAFYHNFLTQDESDPALRREMARAYFRLGKVFMGLGKLQQAQDSFGRARRFQESLAAEFPNDPVHRGDLALTLGYSGDTFRLLGSTAEADPLYARAVELAERLVREHPNESSYRQILAEVVQQQGRHFFQTRRLEEAESSFERGLVELRRLLQDNPGEYKTRVQYADALAFLGYFQQNLRNFGPAESNLKLAIGEFESLIREHPQHKRECDTKLANARMYLAFTYSSMNRAADADALLKQGVTTFEQLVRDYPKSPNYRFILARGHQSMAARIRQSEKPEQAEVSLKSAIGTLEQLDRENPEAFYQALTLRQCYRELGQLYAAQNKLDEAAVLIRKAVEHAEQDEPMFPKNSPTRMELDGHRLVLSQFFSSQGRHIEAIKVLDQAIAHNRSLDRKMPGVEFQLQGLRMHRAVALAASGDHVSALAEAEQAVGPPSKDGVGQYNLACVYALCSVAVRADQKLPTELRQQQSHKLEDKAIEILKSLRSTGYFKNLGNVRQLMQDTDLDALRTRPDFRKFVEEFPVRPKQPMGK